jgi:hypothetical protein
MTGFKRVSIPLAALLACIAAAHAESPRIAEKAKEYQQSRAGWERDAVPPGLRNGTGTAAPGLRSSGVGRVSGRLRNVRFTVVEDIGFFVKDMVVTLEPRRAGDPVNFDDVDSFVIRLVQGEVLLEGAALSALFNRHVLDYPSPPLTNMQISTSEGRLETRAGLRLLPDRPGLEVPARLSGTLTLSNDNRLFYQIDEIDALGIPVAGVLEALGLSLPRLITLERDGVSLTDFGLLLNHRTMFPPPQFAGAVSGVRLDAQGLHLKFGNGPPARFDLPPNLGETYIWLQSGDPKLFGAIVTNARIAIKPAPGKALAFDLYSYRQGLSRAQGQLAEDGLMTLTVP